MVVNSVRNSWGLMPGKVTCRNFCHALHPSILPLRRASCPRFQPRGHNDEIASDAAPDAKKRNHEPAGGHTAEPIYRKPEYVVHPAVMRVEHTHKHQTRRGQGEYPRDINHCSEQFISRGFEIGEQGQPQGYQHRQRYYAGAKLDCRPHRRPEIPRNGVASEQHGEVFERSHIVGQKGRRRELGNAITMPKISGKTKNIAKQTAYGPRKVPTDKDFLARLLCISRV